MDSEVVVESWKLSIEEWRNNWKWSQNLQREMNGRINEVVWREKDSIGSGNQERVFKIQVNDG